MTLSNFNLHASSSVRQQWLVVRIHCGLERTKHKQKTACAYTLIGSFVAHSGKLQIVASSTIGCK